MTRKNAAARDGRRVRIMVIEPNPAIASVLARALAQDGYAVVTASDVQHGVELARTIGVALVVTDMQGGAASLATARRAAALASAPVVAMSGHGATILAFEDARLPLLRKPFAIGALLEAVAGALRATPPSAGLQLLSALSPASLSIL
jgi:DNA-binding response OmpR family regulator